MDRLNSWPVQFILDTGPWQRAYDLAMSQADHCPPDRLANPFDLDIQSWHGFESGRIDAAKIKESANAS